MSLHTPLCDVLGVEYPIVQAPIGSATCPALAAAVANAGGLGTLAVTWRDGPDARSAIRETRELTDAPIGVNIVLDERAKSIGTDTHLDACLTEGVDVVSFSFGEAASYVDRVHDAGAIVTETVGSAAEARAAAETGVDIVVAQGWEAGGHVQSEVATMALVPRVADAVPVPVIAAGGIADGRGIAAAFALGADGVWLGTRFLASEEANVHDAYRTRVAETDENETRYTELFDKGWPEMAHRVVRNETVERWEDADRPAPGQRPGETDVVAEGEEAEPIERYDEALATPDVTGDIEAMALFAGQSAGLTNVTRPAGEIVAELATEAAARIETLTEPLDT
ncbi:NAD(P)H-dependent flavin oxidoreductase [Halococcus saccharolyticus]|uniref:2-nitropropane dioxygenase n=1 Tax=Halococcus saccharolyticus DSM 5350 TaxID=1227455 RepID=M0MIC0_9EURY|nr:nitronate monooxygenase [Halococcus saccharolyticus]EMA44464.1 2-nitropropane dioxygenase [Halococcus saccharolyticus DSM 5350]